MFQRLQRKNCDKTNKDFNNATVSLTVVLLCETCVTKSTNLYIRSR